MIGDPAISASLWRTSARLSANWVGGPRSAGQLLVALAGTFSCQPGAVGVANGTAFHVGTESPDDVHQTRQVDAGVVRLGEVPAGRVHVGADHIVDDESAVLIGDGVVDHGVDGEFK